MAKKGLTITMIFEASSANYGEGVGNISQLKKMTRAGGEVYTYISRQALRYNIVQQMGVDDTPVDNDQKVVQFSPKAKIDEYPEIDLFGYMKTSKGEGQSIRSAVVRLSNAISLEPYKSDTDFLNNMGLAQRAGLENALAQSEIHKSLYSYTITIDLDKVGIDNDIDIPAEEKSRRVELLLDTVQFLNRDIRGRRENLNPVFVVGGVYERKNPYFEDRLRLDKKKLNTGMIEDIINSCDDTKANTFVGCVNGFFENDEEIKETLSSQTISTVFSKLKEEVKNFYA